MPIRFLSTALVAAIAILPASNLFGDVAKLPAVKSPAPAAKLEVSAEYPDLLSSKYTPEQLKTFLVPVAQWTPFPHLEDRNAWAKADKATLEIAIKDGEKFLNYEWPTIPATKSLDIVRSGSRAGYDNLSFSKRGALSALVIAEIAEDKGRFVDDIVNGIWSICEESWWGSSAHLSRGKEHRGLVDVASPSVDLFAATTAETLAWTDYFIGKKLDAVSPQIRKRIAHEIQRRVLQPALKKQHWWMGKRRGGSAPNNWNPWICSNWLASVLLIEKDENVRAQHVARILTILDNFANHYPQDGGCDEGPGYWNAAPGSLFDNISLLNSATNNAFKYVFEDEKIKNMGKFIYRMQISDKYAVNFSDASPYAGCDGLMVYRFGKAINDKQMMAFGANSQFAPRIRNSAHFGRMFHELFTLDEFRNAKRGIPLPVDVWLPDLQVASAREKEGSSAGFYFAAKGGNNNESHNHNDVGNFVVYHDGLPVLIDIGSGRYTAQTFSAGRYDIWNMRSEYHNTPTINGVNQWPAGTACATNTAHKSNAESSEFSANIEKAYLKAADINNWHRTVTLNRGKNVVIKDATDLRRTDSIVENLMTPHRVDVTGENEVTIYVTDGKSKTTIPFLVQFSGAKSKTTVEKIVLSGESDEGVKRNWGDNIHRIQFTITAPEARGNYTITVTKK